MTKKRGKLSIDEMNFIRQNCFYLSINDIEVQEIRQGDSTGHDGRASNSDNQ